MDENMFLSPINALVSGYDYDALYGPGKPEKYVITALRWSTTIPGISTVTKPLHEGANLFWGNVVDERVVQLAKVLIEELNFRDKQFEEFKRHMMQFEQFIGETRGSLLLRQAIGGTQRTADKTKIERIGHILLNGALQWPQGDQEQELAQQHMAEFIRIAEILTDTDVLVLRAIYDAQSPLISRHKELVNSQAHAMTIEGGWMQEVFRTWHHVRFSAEGQALGFLNVHSALVRLESQGLIARAGSQTVAAQDPTAVTTTPYGLLELGAMFVESAISRIRNSENK